MSRAPTLILSPCSEVLSWNVGSLCIRENVWPSRAQTWTLDSDSAEARG